MTTITTALLSLVTLSAHLSSGVFTADAVLAELATRLKRAQAKRPDGFKAMRLAVAIAMIERDGQLDMAALERACKDQLARKRAARAAQTPTPAPAAPVVDAPAMALTTAQSRELTRSRNFIAGLDADSRDAILAALTA